MLQSSAAHLRAFRARTGVGVVLAGVTVSLGAFTTAFADAPPTCAAMPALIAAPSQPLVVPRPRCVDPDGLPVTIAVPRPPRSGTLSEPDRQGDRVYVPSGRGRGRDSVVFVVGDGSLTTSVVQVILLLRAEPVRKRSTKRPVDDGAGDLCSPRRSGEHCAAGRGRQTAGGGGTGKVTHQGWPAVTGILWKVVSSGRGRHEKTGGPDNDELLGHHGDDTVVGGAGHDILWGDWDPSNNNTSQHDELRGGSGNDWLYSSHGRNEIYGGAGTDHVWAYYGRGVIDCGPGEHDVARTKLGAPFTVRNCETIGHFCAFGPDGHGGCLKPGEHRATGRRVRSYGRAVAALF
jgi:hypothetical protein